MGKTLLTGASGFIGSHLAKALAARGDELRVLARRGSDLGGIDGLEYERVTGDITDRRAIRRAVAGATKVFNVAGRTSLRDRDRDAVFAANLRGARILFEESLGAGVERVVQTSTVGAIGIAKPASTADETTPFEIGHLGLAYVNSKHEAELEAFRAAAHGLSVVIVNPTFVLGPDVPSGSSGSSMGLVRRFLLGKIPAYVDGGINVVDVRDVADAHLLADVKGEVGERYIIGARNFTFDRLFADLSRISGVAPPAVKLPAGMAVAGATLAERLQLPVMAGEVRSASLWWTYKNTKAKRELGFSPRPHEETLEEAVAWQAAKLGDRVAKGTRTPIALRAGAAGLRAAGRVIGR